MPEPLKTSDQPVTAVATSPLRCFTGALLAGSLSIVMYRMTIAIATTFANKPVTSDNSTVIALSSAVRTLVIGMVALGTGVFGIAALGLLLLGIQVLFEQLRGEESES
ncbi:MAG: DUF3082 domain-containing protein [Leptolyngbya sp. SIO4C1]|nr:DUF3082 domain-containing protein [Leptolyngbya sp. SIO4C1]